MQFTRNTSAVDETLILNGAASSKYGNNWDGLSDDDGKVTFDFDLSAVSGDLNLDLTAYDIDNATEMKIILNGTDIGYLDTTANNASNSQSFTISSSGLTTGTNTLTFQNASPNWYWGVSDVAISTASSLADPTNEPLFSSQWHLHETNGANVVNAWNQTNSSGEKIYGTGILIGIIDDGLDHSHPDLSENYVPSSSYDFVDEDSDPTPFGDDAHGTAAGGVAGGYGHNGVGITGAAPNASLSGLLLLGAGTDSNEAAALNYTLDAIDIYSNSWGPDDDGRLHPSGPLFIQAVANGVTNGRDGLGAIYSWAGGNGREHTEKMPGEDNSNYDGWANSRYVNAIAAIGSDGLYSSYSEAGANILVAAPSNSWRYGTSAITTTDIVGYAGYSTDDYAYDFGGTSSACPLFSGVVALILDANPNLTWRDLQHVIVESADSTVDSSSSGWITNGAGHPFNHDYGFGRLDAEAAVLAAKNWINVGTEVSHTQSSTPNQTIPASGSTLTDTINVSQDIIIETIEIPFISNHTWRGDLSIELTSPEGTTATLAKGEPDPLNGRSDSGSYNFTFSAKTFWGESSTGEWTLSVSDQKTNSDTGDLNSWGINFFGTEGSNFSKTAKQSPNFINDDIIGSSGLTYASKDALNGVPGLSSYIHYLEENLIKSKSINQDTQKWVIASDHLKKRDLKAAGLQKLGRKGSLTSETGDIIRVFQADMGATHAPKNLIDNLDTQFGSNVVFAYPDIAHDLQSRSILPSNPMA